MAHYRPFLALLTPDDNTKEELEDQQTSILVRVRQSCNETSLKSKGSKRPYSHYQKQRGKQHNGHYERSRQATMLGRMKQSETTTAYR